MTLNRLLSLLTLWALSTVAMAQTCPAGNPRVAPDSRYTIDSANGVVTDLATGLMWKRCSEGQSGATCTDTAATTHSWSAALGLANMSGHAGFTDWRLPNYEELRSLVETACFSPSINTVAFPATVGSLGSSYWSSTTFAPFAPNASRAWHVFFDFGILSANDKVNSQHVRLVRGGQWLDPFASEARNAPGDGTAPDAFAITPQTGVPLASLRTSDPVTVAGLTTVTGIGVSGAAGSTYSINGGPYTAVPGAVANGDQVRVRHTSAAVASTNTTTTLTIGGVTADFVTTTACATNPVVANGNDSGAGSLRQAIVDACTGSTVTFASGVNTVTLTTAELVIDKNLTIQGPGPNQLAVTRGVGAGDFRIFRVAGITVTMTGLTISNGSLVGLNGGGGVFAQANSNLTLRDCVVSDNAAGLGGGVLMSNADGEISRCTIRGNTSFNSGGGIHFQYSGPRTLRVINTTLANNTSNGDRGGAILNFANGAGVVGILEVINATIVNNAAPGGGGIANLSQSSGSAATTRLRNTLFSGNSTSLGAGVGFGGGPSVITSLGNNLASDDGGGFLTGSGDLINTNARLAALGAYGGTTPTFALLPGSPAINAGSATDAPSTDQRGIARVGAVDIGAFESRGFTLAIEGGNNQVASPGAAFAQPLAVRVAPVASGEPVSGGAVSYTAPGSGASATLASNPASINASGVASTAATANATTGAYTVGAAANGASPALSFALSNQCPSTLVTNGNDSGAGSLRQVIADACPNSTITFAAGVNTVGLTTAQLLVEKNLTIDGGGGVTVTRVAGSTNFRIFRIAGGTTVAISGLTISNGSTTEAGGGVSSEGALTLTHCAITGNSATNFGGGIFSLGPTVIDGCTISGNQAGNAGGLFHGLNTLTLSNTTVSNNTTEFQGSGINIQDATATLVNCTISGNRSTSSQAGIAHLVASRPASSLTITNCTVTDNVGAAQGFGGVWSAYFSNTLGRTLVTRLQNTVVAANFPDNFTTTTGTASTRVPTPNGFLTSLGHNLDSDGTSGFVNGSNGDLVGSVGTPINALLAPLGDFGGRTRTHALLPGSPAVNAGSNAACAAAPVGGLDQRGVARPQLSTCDIGAFESRGFTLTPNSGSGQSTFVNTAFANPLVVSVAPVAAGEPVAGGVVRYTAPGSGASASLGSADAVIDASGNASTTASANGTTGGYAVGANTNGSTSGVSFALTNLAAPTVSVVPTTLSVNEAGETSDSFLVSLSTAPTANVTIPLTFDANVQVNAGSGFGVSPQTVTLTPANALSGVTVTVRAVDDALVEASPHFSTITTAATSSAQAVFNGLTVPDVTVAITDNDTAGINVIESAGSTAVTEGGGTDTYSVVLTSQPTANVSVALSFDSTQVNINGNSSGSLGLVFTPGNWNTAQVLTVSAVDDTLVEANPHTSTIVQTASSTDPLYAAINPADVTASITDNESATVALVSTASNAAETAGTASLSAQLQLLSNGVSGGTLAVPVSAQVVLTPGSAAAGSDYTPSTVSVSFASGTTHNATRPIDVGVVNDRLLEGAETFTVSLAPAGSIGTVSGSHVVTLIDDEAGVFSFTAPTASVPEAAGPYTGAAQLLISGSGEGSVFRIQNAASVALSATPGSAISPADYSLLTTTLEVPANAASPVSLPVQVAIVNDGIDEANETFTLGFGAVSGSGALSATGSQVVTIVDDDLAGVTVTQSGGSTAVTEGGATDTYTLVLTSQPTADVTVALAGGTQLTTAPISVSFTTMNWATPQTVTVTAVDDAVVEGPHNGSVTHTVTSADATYDGLLVDTVSVTITDNDTASVTVMESGGSTAVTEGGATDTFSVVLSSQPVADVTVTVTTGTQLSVNTNPLVFTAANWNVARVVTVSAVDDNVVEGPDSGTLSFAVTSADPAYAAIPLAPITVAITDNDSAVVSFSPISVSQSEATSPMVFTVALSAPVASGVTLTVNSANGTALAPADYTAIVGQTLSFAANSTTPQTVSVAINNDALFEADEAFMLTLSNLVATGTVTLGSTTATGTIVNDDAAPTITINAPSVNEGNAGTTPMSFVVSLSAASGLPVNFNFATGTGTATAGADYTAIPSTLGSIAAGSSSLTIPVSVLGDTISEANEAVVLNLTGISNANVSSLSGTGTILDDDVAQIRIEDAGLTEGDSGSQNLSFTVTRSDNGGAFSVNYATANGTAIAGSDYTASSGTLNFSSGGALSQTLEVPITGDLLVEVTESFSVTLGAVVNSVGTAAIDRATATGTITDNDSATVQFAPASVSQSEATTPTVYTVTLTNPVASGVTVTVNSADGTATAGSDYTAVVNQTVTFAPNSTTAQTVSVAVTNDALDEDNETYTLTLSNPVATGDVSLGAATATGTIEDDDALPTLSVANVTQPEGNAVNTLTFTVNLSPVSGRAVSFTRATEDGSAVSTGPNADFVALAAGPITIPAGQTSVEIPVTINGDTVFEGDEQFTLSLTGVSNATPGSLSATATLTEDDQQPTTTTITADLPDPSVVGQPYPVTVEVRAQTLSPLGTVEVTDGTGASCNAPLVAGTAPLSTMTCTLTSTSAGNKTLTASSTPASSAFGESSDTEAHTVNAAATSLVLLGPARARIGTVATYTAEISVTAPGAGTPAGTVTVTAGANSCTITLPTATPSCTITYSSLGSRSVSAVFAASNGDFVGSTATPVQTLVFANADISVTKTNGVHTYRPGDLLVYTVVVRNIGPDAAPQVRIRDAAPVGLTNVAWTCEASSGAVCPDAGGTGTLDHVVETLPAGGVLTYAYFGNVIGRPLSIVNVAELTLPADTTIEDPNAANNSATDSDLLDDLFADGFEAPGINAETGGVRLAGASLRSTLDEVARVSVRLGDVRGEALRVYARVVGGELQVALAVRAADGTLRLGSWQRTSGEPELTWTATPAAGGFVLSGASLR